ncbi:aldose epimerase family protein [Mucilaginibacter aquariorum]|uniref:Aldose 1-epimerase n=1 Tax=Mucilaginibacter aquariorum TaxID=2967225 RepID=A0ABT1T6L6_9SPHI|nr:aldose epimerase family protein [Mucilaginibacter aquariorum]MCQ6960103.1 galactose mutarotase [Mucilaginibacter aquariorum]
MCKKFFNGTLFAAGIFFTVACNNISKPKQTSDVADSLQNIIPDSASFNAKVENKQVKLYTLKNKNGVEVAITNYGGRLVSLLVPDRKGKLVDVILGYENLKNYRELKENYFGALIGRYGNRIAKGKFTLDGKLYQVNVNDGPNSLHGGANGFFKQVWDVTKVTGQTLELSYLSKDGEEGYPGNLKIIVAYTLKDDNSLEIAYQATTDKTTVINLTNHAYFNLNGASGTNGITNHLLQINADAYTPVDSLLIPTGKVETVKGSAFDFTTAKAIGKDIGLKDQQLAYGKGYDHNFVLNKHRDNEAVVTLLSPVTGIQMQVFTTEPGIQFYSGNFLKGDDKNGKGGVAYKYRSALCLETQHFPDSPNQPGFPSTVLTPGKAYNTVTTYSFTTK